jgi:hypothetical protein
MISIKVRIFREGNISTFDKIFHSVLKSLSKQEDIFFSILWPSHNNIYELYLIDIMLDHPILVQSC